MKTAHDAKIAETQSTPELRRRALLIFLRDLCVSATA